MFFSIDSGIVTIKYEVYFLKTEVLNYTVMLFSLSKVNISSGYCLVLSPNKPQLKTMLTETYVAVRLIELKERRNFKNADELLNITAL